MRMMMFLAACGSGHETTGPEVCHALGTAIDAECAPVQDQKMAAVQQFLAGKR